MKVLLLNGSANKNGNTFTALSEIARQLEKNGVESEIMQLGNKPVRGCIACGQCQAKQLGHCVFDDDICNRIVEKLNEADALIVGSPVYYGQPNGAVMAVLQRAFSLAFDAKELTYISSAGLRLILSVQKHLGQKISVINVSSNVMAIFQMAGFQTLMHIKGA